MNDLRELLHLSVETVHRLASKVSEAETQLVGRPYLARRVGNVGASLLAEVAAACECIRSPDSRMRVEGLAALREARALIGQVRHAVSLDCALVSSELRSAISNDCDELLALLLATTAAAMHSSPVDPTIGNYV